jgi:hypothetical protein
MRMTFRDLLDLVLVVAVMIMATVLIGLTAGCTDDRPVPLPPVDARVVTNTVMVATPCIDAAQLPIVPPPGLALTGDAAHDAGLIASRDLALRRSLELSLALLGGCVR